MVPKQSPEVGAERILTRVREILDDVMVALNSQSPEVRNAATAQYAKLIKLMVKTEKMLVEVRGAQSE